MDTQYENRYLANDKMLSEYVRKVLYKNLRTTAFIFSAFAGIMLLYTSHRNSDVLSAILVMSLLLMLSVAILSPILAIRQIKESSKRITNGQTYETVVKFGDNISMTEGTFSLTIEYSQVLKIHNLQYSYVLMFGKHNAIIICPKHFTVGTFEDFKIFIEQKVILTK